MGWRTICDVQALPEGTQRVHREGRVQVLCGHLNDGTLYAVDNRCPHEGYPLSQGALDGGGGTLTCLWHNFKFDVRSGVCLKGDEALPTFPIRVTPEGTVEVDLSRPDPQAALPALWRSLDEALSARRVGQSVRDAARLLEAGVSPAALAATVAAWDADHAEYGASHALPIAADVLRWQALYPGPRFAVPLAQVLDLASLNGVRRPARPTAAPALDLPDDPAVAGQQLRDAVEAEDAPRAEALLRAARAKGWSRTALVPWFFHLCADHFLDFGHALIFLVKALDLIDAVGWEAPQVTPILAGLLEGIVQGTREDLLPPWAAFRKRLALLDLAAVYACATRPQTTSSPWTGRDDLVAVLLDGRPAQVIPALTLAWTEQGASLQDVADALALAAAERMLRFDTRIDGDDHNQDSWLSVSHLQTYAHAVGSALHQFHHPEVLRLVYMGARFIHHHRVLDLPPDHRLRCAPASHADPRAALDAIRDKQADHALDHVLAIHHQGSPLDQKTLLDGLMTLVISDQFAAPIVSAHAIKNLVVAQEETSRLRDPRPLLAAVRLLASPLQQRWTHRSALEAVAFVTEGRVPTVLAP